MDVFLVTDTKFMMGRIVATTNAIDRLEASDICDALVRHGSGDWGDLDPEDRRSNDVALEHDLRLLSAYNAKNGTRFWIITEWDRSYTTVLLPDDY